ncbi:MAG: oxygen-independent coproporphyrinogen III oxidase [Bacteroidetes bacterium]|jgi:oxygen-independent coproporphyrinogen-3 oxidase|nr:oxygen-independent coproporphyrinogen III oxidase [Bacteroidota bacterium]
MGEDKLSKYNIPVPRYTSYPPANYFSEQYSENDFLHAVEESNYWEPKNISFYVHIPFCQKMCFYCGCNSCPFPKGDIVKKYHDALLKEIRLLKGRIDPNRRISQIHFGGGTPNTVSADYLSEIVNVLKSEMQFIPRPEIAIECNPAYLDKPYIDQLKKIGFNRFSLGIQDFSHEVLKNVNRAPSQVPVNELVAYIRQDNDEIAVNLDFIYGLPGQTSDSFRDCMKQALAIKPERLVTFSYAHVPWFNKRQKQLEKKGLPSQDMKQEMFDNARHFLLENGYKSIGLDHFVLDSDELYSARESQQLKRNFMGYCTTRTTGQVYAFGVSAIHQLQFAYAQNTKSVDEYIASINNGQFPIIKGYRLNKDEMLIREVIEQIMCNERLCWTELSDKFNMDTEGIKNTLHYDEESLKNMEKDGLIIFTQDGFSVTTPGSPFIRNVAASLDPLMQKRDKQFSKVV